MSKQKNFVLYDESVTFDPEQGVSYHEMLLENEFLYESVDALQKANVELDGENSLDREERLLWHGACENFSVTIDTLRKSVARQRAEIVQLDGQAHYLKSLLDCARTNYESSKSKAVDLADERDSLAMDNTALKEENSLIREENARVIGCDDELVAKSERLEADNNKLAHDNKVLTKENQRFCIMLVSRT